MPYLIDIVEV